jgi:hypothetical protein
LLAADTRRQAALADLLGDRRREVGGVDEDAVAAMTDRYRLDS